MKRSDQQRLILIVDSGPHVGAQMTLMPGESYQVGRDLDCDLVLRDKALADQHLRLTITADNGIEMEVLDGGKAGVNGRPLKESRCTLAPEDVISLGESVLRLYRPLPVRTQQHNDRLAGAEDAPEQEEESWDDHLVNTLLDLCDQAGGALRRATLWTVLRGGALHPRFEQPLQPLRRWLESLQGHSLRNAQFNTGLLRGRLASIIGGVALPAGRAARINRLALPVWATSWIPAGTGGGLRVGKPPAWAVSLGAVVVVAAVLSGPVWSSIPSSTSAEAMRTQITELTATLAQQQLPDVRVTMDTQGKRLNVSGVVADRDALERLHTVVQDYPADVAVRVAATELSRVQAVFERVGLPGLTVTHAHGDTFIVSGYVPDRKHWQAVAETLVKDFAAVGKLRDDGVFDSEQRRIDLTRQLETAELHSLIDVRRGDDDGLVADGVVSRRQLELWARVLADFRREYGELPPVESRVQSINSVMDIDLRSVSVGDVPYVVMRNGERFITGSALPGGYVIDRIHPEHLVLNRNGRQYHYHLGD
ncbi:MAG: type III secretion system inner membrane ring subunit SctD [Aquisalimonadaceae bacterium]